jgi:hypothetical protein
MGRPLFWLLVALAPASIGAVQAAPPGPDCSARYDVSGGGIDVPGIGTTPRTMMLTGSAIELDGWCRLEGLKRKVRPSGSVRLRRRFRSCGPLRAGRFEATVWQDCSRLSATVKAKRLPGRFQLFGLRHVPPSTFHVIEDRIFSDRGCAVAACHGAGRAGMLDLRPGAAYANLVGVEPDNAAAREKGWLRVTAADVGRSFLSVKIRGTVGPDEGSRMPLTGDPLTVTELELIDAWIAAGAPPNGEVDGAPELPPRVYEETPPLSPPANGYQLVLDGPTLAPGQEQEGCLWVPAPTASDVPIRAVEIALNPGTHHFVIWRHGGGAAPPLGTWLANDVACLGSGGNFGQQIAGAPHAPYFRVEQPPGFATLMPGGGYYGLNAHYYNESSAPIRMKVWVNLYPYEGTPAHLAQLLPFDLSASGKINVAPFARAAVQGRYTNTSGRTMHLMGLGGHMHKRGVRFSIWTSDGTKVLDDYDWAHPTFAPFEPARPLPPGDWIDFECLHDNGVDRPVRRDYAGNPMTIVFGTSAEDEMCILTGQYYDD